jgi:hypothetical protein
MREANIIYHITLKSSSPTTPLGGGTHLLNQRDWVVMKWEDESRFSSYCDTLQSYVPVNFDLILVNYMILDRMYISEY